MNKEELIGRLLTATPGEVERIEAVFTGTTTATLQPSDRRLLTLTEAAADTGLSRVTVWRMCKDGRLPFVETRAGRKRIPSAAITTLVAGGAE